MVVKSIVEPNAKETVRDRAKVPVVDALLVVVENAKAHAEDAKVHVVHYARSAAINLK